MTVTDMEPLADEARPGSCSCGRDDMLDDHDWQPGCDEPYPLDGRVTLDYMLTIPGMTYRRLDYWVRVGILEPGNDQPGSGYNRHWTYRDHEVARLILALTHVGIELHLAADAAIAKVDHDDDELHIGNVTLTWSVDEE